MSDVRLGLALSGGGFRAAFFHLGVLARMAELDLLRHVESISTVSGGSIIGALYYIHLKNLLETVPDDQIGRDHYLDLVRRIEASFSEAVKRNLRMCTFASVRHNMKMAMPNYSRSDRIGELYDEYIFRPAWNKPKEAPRTTPIMMHELKIHPMGDRHEKDFNPTHGHNAERKNKVPVLNINASVLNTGHDWRFTAVDMGEVVHDKPLDVDIDKNTRLLKGRYKEICRREQGFLLGKAVAASACVPGLFPPLAVSSMYDMRIKLVDGGVYDNQGVDALLNGGIECTHLILSDASGQMRDDMTPEDGTFSVISRTTSILMGRVREEMIGQACDKYGENRVAIMHMTQGLPVMFMRHRGTDCKPLADERSQVGDPIPQYDQDMRGRIARIRTDLDSFHDTEARSIITLGYVLSTAKLDNLFHQLGLRKHPHDTVDWPFLTVADWLQHEQHAPAKFRKQLDVAEQKFGKWFRMGLTPGLLLALAMFISGLVVYGGLIVAAIEWLQPGAFKQVWHLLETTSALTLILWLAGFLLLKVLDSFGKLFKALRFIRAPYKYLLVLIARFMLPPLGAIPVKLYLLTLDRYYVNQGRLE